MKKKKLKNISKEKDELESVLVKDDNDDDSVESFKFLEESE